MANKNQEPSHWQTEKVGKNEERKRNYFMSIELKGSEWARRQLWKVVKKLPREKQQHEKGENENGVNVAERKENPSKFLRLAA